MKTLRTLTLLCLAAACSFAQNRTSFGGIQHALDFAYGINDKVSPLRIEVGNPATGSQVITLTVGYVTLADGTELFPLATTAPITVGIGSTAETVTPSAVSCSTPKVYSTCQITATFSNLHYGGERISSGTFGIEESVNFAHALGGLVAVDGLWTAAGGVTSTITSNKGWTNVTVLDWRGTTAAKSYIAGSNGSNMAASAISLY